jgi:hypothetical protein
MQLADELFGGVYGGNSHAYQFPAKSEVIGGDFPLAPWVTRKLATTDRFAFDLTNDSKFS